MRVKRTVFSAALLATATAGDARAAIADGKLPDGAYHCEVYMLGLFLDLGEITIRGNVYSGPRLFGEPQQSYNYQLSPNGEIAWLGPVGGYTSGGNSISLTQVTSDGETDASFDIIMRQPDGAFTASTCTIVTPQKS
ncbi:hypothetical protein [Aquamicrobium soli]|jgi:hypothetical protein|uniref:Phage tail protein n=1 Tax=Aquamicrobium soli TaxID=1811518 RepID=A0ABV7KGK4_9HYPH